jgi:hypothetical protein
VVAAGQTVASEDDEHAIVECVCRGIFYVDKASGLVFAMADADGDESEEVGSWDAEARVIDFLEQPVTATLVAPVPAVPAPVVAVEMEEELEEELVAILCSATGASELAATRLLREAGGDLDEAINRFYATDDDGGDGAVREAERLRQSQAREEEATAEDEAAAAAWKAKMDEAAAAIVVIFTKQGTLGINFGDDGVTWPVVESVAPGSLAAAWPTLVPGLTLQLIEGAAGKREVTPATTFAEGMQIFVAARRCGGLAYQSISSIVYHARF